MSLDPAINALKADQSELRTAPHVEASELAARISELRELLWCAESLAKTITEKYGNLHEIKHDKGDDPHNAVTTVTMRLADVSLYLSNADEALEDSHTHASRLSST